MPGPIGPSMRKVLDEIAASKTARDAAATSNRCGPPGNPAAGPRRGALPEDVANGLWERLEALERESAEQTRLLREILARLPSDRQGSGVSAGNGR